MEHRLPQTVILHQMVMMLAFCLPKSQCQMRLTVCAVNCRGLRYRGPPAPARSPLAAAAATAAEEGVAMVARPHPTAAVAAVADAGKLRLAISIIVLVPMHLTSDRFHLCVQVTRVLPLHRCPSLMGWGCGVRSPSPYGRRRRWVAPCCCLTCGPGFGRWVPKPSTAQDSIDICADLGAFSRIQQHPQTDRHSVGPACSPSPVRRRRSPSYEPRRRSPSPVRRRRSPSYEPRRSLSPVRRDRCAPHCNIAACKRMPSL